MRRLRAAAGVAGVASIALDALTRDAAAAPAPIRPDGVTAAAARSVAVLLAFALAALLALPAAVAAPAHATMGVVRAPRADAPTERPPGPLGAADVGVSAMQAWLALLDDGDYDGCWAAASDGFRQSVSARVWSDRARASRAFTGRRVERRLRAAGEIPFGPSNTIGHDLPGTMTQAPASAASQSPPSVSTQAPPPEGRPARVVASFDTRFEDGGRGTESVTVDRDATGRWRVSAYALDMQPAGDRAAGPASFPRSP